MSKALDLTVLTDDGGFGRALSETRLVSDDGSPAMVGPQRVPGAMGGWYELVVAFGVTALPVGVLASYIANWITNALNKTDSAAPIKAKLVFEHDGRAAELVLETDDAAKLSEVIRGVLADVYSDP